MKISEWIEATGIDPFRCLGVDGILTPAEFCKIQGYDITKYRTVELYLWYIENKFKHHPIFSFRKEKDGIRNNWVYFSMQLESEDVAKNKASNWDWEFLGHKNITNANN